MIQTALARRHHVEVALTSRRGHASRLARGAAATGTDVVVVLGGDGTLNEAANGLVGTDCALAALPGGSTNVFARTIGTPDDPLRANDAVVEALDAGSIVNAGLGEVSGRYFLFHCGMGFDAAVVQDLASRGTGPISHWTYLPSMLRELWSWKPVPVGIMVDGEGVGSDQPGLCFVCNCREYGGGFNPAPDALMDDGLLDVVFLPPRSRIGLLRWMWKARRGTHLTSRGALHARGRRIVLEPASPVPWQVDGDCPAESATPLTQRVTIEVRSGVLPVLRPAGDASRT